MNIGFANHKKGVIWNGANVVPSVAYTAATMYRHL